MRFCRFQSSGEIRYGLIEPASSGDVIRAVVANLPASEADSSCGEGVEIPLTAVHLLAPVCPTKIVCIGRNYREHAKELNHEIPKEPLIFLKPPSAVLAPGATILRPAALSQLSLIHI